MTRAFPNLTFAKRAFFLAAALRASLALALPQNGSQGSHTPYTLSPSTSSSSTRTASTTHLPPSLIHSSLPTPKLQVQNDQGENIWTETVFSTIIIPTTTELTTILTVTTNTNAPYSPSPPPSPSTTTSFPVASTSSKSTTGPNPHCILEGGAEADGLCATIVPICPTIVNTLAPAQAEVKGQAQIQSETHSSAISLVPASVIKVLTVVVAAHTTYTLTGFAPLLPTTSSASNPTTAVTCPSPSWLIDGHCVYNTPGWNPAPQVPTETDDGWDGRPRPPWETQTGTSVV